MSGTIQTWRKWTGSVFEAFISLWVTPVPARMNWISPGRMTPPPPVESLCASPPSSTYERISMLASSIASPSSPIVR